MFLDELFDIACLFPPPPQVNYSQLGKVALHSGAPVNVKQLT